MNIDIANIYDKLYSHLSEQSHGVFLGRKISVTDVHIPLGLNGVTKDCWDIEILAERSYCSSTEITFKVDNLELNLEDKVLLDINFLDSTLSQRLDFDLILSGTYEVITLTKNSFAETFKYKLSKID